DDDVLTERELTMAVSLVESMSGPFEPEKYHDTYREQVLDLIERKAQGLGVGPAETTAPAANVVDLMAALEASVNAAKESRGRHPRGGPRRAPEPPWPRPIPPGCASRSTGANCRSPTSTSRCIPNPTTTGCPSPSAT